jgi:hypothetical protein
MQWPSQSAADSDQINAGLGERGLIAKVADALEQGSSTDALGVEFHYRSPLLEMDLGPRDARSFAQLILNQSRTGVASHTGQAQAQALVHDRLGVEG